MEKRILFSNCSLCGYSYPDTEDYFGEGHLCNKCLKNKKHSYASLQQVKRQEFYDILIQYMGGKCESCGHSFPTYVYDFHHIDASIKESNISQMMVRYSKKKEETILKEADKCILLCANCHRKLHWIQKYGGK